MPAVPHKVSLGESHVTIEWSDGHVGRSSNVRLREACLCAVCSGEPPALGTSRVIRLAPAAAAGVKASSYSMVGRYAISFSWSDGHGSGIYPYDYLRGMCECDDCRDESDGRR